jgi:Flp pilus assembly protein TadG
MRGTNEACRPQDRQGAIAVLAAFCMALVLVFLAFSVDWGYLTVTESDLQNAADAGALSGARALPDGRSAAIAAAQDWAARNFAAGESVGTSVSEDIEIGLWETGTATFTILPDDASESPNAVRVTCRRTAARGNAVNLFFAPLIGTDSADVEASAIAIVLRNRCGVVVGLDTVDVGNGHIDSYNSSAGTYFQQSPGQNGHVCSDGAITLGPVGTIAGNAAPGAGFTVNEPDQVTGDTTPRSTPIKWNPIDQTGVSTDNENDTVSSGNLNNGRLRVVGNQTLTLNPGTYYFPNGIEVLGTSTIVVTGATRIVMGGDSFIAGNGIVNAAQVPANLRIDIVNGAAEFTGNSAFHADVYGPTADVSVEGNAGFFGAIFGKTVRLNGNAAEVHGDEALQREYDETMRSKLVY